VKNLILAGAAVAVIGALVPADAQHATNNEDILGTWTVDTLKATTAARLHIRLARIQAASSQ
jgi:hypothetical protein